MYAKLCICLFTEDTISVDCCSIWAVYFVVLQCPVACVVQSAAFALSNLARDKQTHRSVIPISNSLLKL